MFNLLFARDVQASFGMAAQSILTTPLLVGTDGSRKMSKSFGNYVGVTDPPEEMFGKLMSVPDEALPEYYLLLLDEDVDPGRHPGEAKRELGRRIVDRFHGDGAGAAAEERFDQVHVRHEVPEDLEEAEVSADGDGTVHLPALIADVFGLSRSEARRLLGQGGVRLSGEVVDPGTLDVSAGSLDAGASDGSVCDNTSSVPSVSSSIAWASSRRVRLSPMATLKTSPATSSAPAASRFAWTTLAT